MTHPQTPAPADGRAGWRGPARTLARRVLPGIGVVAAQVTPYADRWAELNAASIRGRGPLWVAVGDSMSQGIGASTIEGGWVPQASRLLQAAGRSYRLVNLSRSGATTQDVVERQLPAMAALGARPSLVTVLVGANDMLRARTRRLLVERYRMILSALPERSVVACLPQPVRVAREVNGLIIDSGGSHGFVPLDVRPVARGWRGARAEDLFHPNEHAYARLAELVTEAALTLPYP